MTLIVSSDLIVPKQHAEGKAEELGPPQNQLIQPYLAGNLPLFRGGGFSGGVVGVGSFCAAVEFTLAAFSKSADETSVFGGKSDSRNMAKAAPMSRTATTEIRMAFF
jgi:hypothetical protein